MKHPALTMLGATDQAIEKFKKYEEMIRLWNKSINLVAPSTISDIWDRHILDSAQLFPHVKDGTITDLGSGGGLPALVLAMMGVPHVTMVESDTRKCVFLREVSRETGLSNVTVLNQRIEQGANIKTRYVTARALAPLPQLVEWATPCLETGGKMVFLKGQDAAAEVAALPADLQATVTLIPSVTDAKASVVIIPA